MELREIKEKIRHYLDSTRQTPLLIDVTGAEEMTLLELEFKVGKNEFIDTSQYCVHDSLPQMDKLLNDLTEKTCNVFLTGLSTFLLLQGEDVLRKTLRSLLDVEVRGKLVVMTYRCSPMMNFKDPRLRDAGRIVTREDVKGTLPTIYLVAPELADNVEASANGINGLSQMVEQDERPLVYVRTNKTKHDFPQALFSIKQYSSAYDMLVKKYAELQNLVGDYGTEEQWAYLLKAVDDHDGWHQFVESELGGTTYLGQNIGKMKTMTGNQQWAFFIAMKQHGVKSRPYLSQVLALSSTVSEMYENAYSLLLATDCKSKNFGMLYKERRLLLESLNVPIAVVSDFCKQVEARGETGIYYLTNCTKRERELTMELIATYAETLDRKSTEQLLRTVLPQLADYLASYDYGNELLTKYFAAYVYNKVTNQITPDLRSMMEEQAVKRDYNLLLQPRSLLLSKQDLTHTKAYFVDALGAEFAAYIRECCYSRNMDCVISFGCCNLPSITEKNKEFEQTFTEAGVQLVSVKDLDKVKHEGTGLYNYEHTKLPVHLLEELRIIDRVMENVDNDLSQDGIEKVLIVSDHGASRLAVINENENKWEMSEKGLHSGRCCPQSDINEKPDFAIEEDGFWCLANYDRFKGGRRAQVEVHGGATLEEVTVPVITISRAGDKPKCEILDKIITVSFKKKACFRLFISKQVDNVKVVINGKTYEATPTEQKYVYEVKPDVKRGEYTIEVYIGDNKIAQDLPFEVKSAGASENKYF